jgi:hypothetical protein
MVTDRIGWSFLLRQRQLVSNQSVGYLRQIMNEALWRAQQFQNQQPTFQTEAARMAAGQGQMAPQAMAGPNEAAMRAAQQPAPAPMAQNMNVQRGFRSPYGMPFGGMMPFGMGGMGGMGGMMPFGMGGMMPFGMGGMMPFGGFQQPMMGGGGCPPWMPGCNGNFGGVYGGGGGGGYGTQSQGGMGAAPLNEATLRAQGGTSFNDGSWM